MFKAIKPRGYASRFLRRIKSEVANNFKPSIANKNGAMPCLGPRCTRCKLIVKCESVFINNIDFVINSPLDCNSDCVIYIITCKLCDIHYVGETQNSLRTRLNNHLSDINIKKPTNVSIHFNGHFHGTEHDIDQHFRITPIMKVPHQRQRRYREACLIKNFKTYFPFGLNDRSDNLSQNDAFIPLVLPYHPTSYEFAKAIKDKNIEHNASKNRIIVAYKRNKNLKDLLSPSNAGQKV